MVTGFVPRRAAACLGIMLAAVPLSPSRAEAVTSATCEPQPACRMLFTGLSPGVPGAKASGLRGLRPEPEAEGRPTTPKPAEPPAPQPAPR